MKEVDSFDEFVRKYRRILVFGAGGGGDSIGALHIYFRIKDLGGSPILGSVVWERYVVDPIPGPLPLEAMINVEPIGWSAAIATGDSYAIRPSGEVKPQLFRVAKVLGEKVLAIDISKGAEGVKQALEAAREFLGTEAAIAVDVGGDILAKGCEEELWSPLADAVSLAGLASASVPSLVAVHAPGADGELPPEKVLAYISNIASEGGLIGVTGLQRKDIPLLKRVLEEAVSEASAVPVRAFTGYYGKLEIRSKTRIINVSPLQVVTYMLDTSKVFELSEVAKEVMGTKGIGEARRRLNARCVYTELDLEMDISEAMALKRSVNPLTLRTQGREALKRKGCRPINC
jgi:hypothetical protein